MHLGGLQGGGSGLGPTPRPARRYRSCARPALIDGGSRHWAAAGLGPTLLLQELGGFEISEVFLRAQAALWLVGGFVFGLLRYGTSCYDGYGFWCGLGFGLGFGMGMRWVVLV